MAELKLTQSVPLTRTAGGVFRVSGSRVTLDSIVRQFKSGATAEQIQEDFPSVTLTDIYAVIAYFMQHRRSVDNYLRDQASLAQRVRDKLERTLGNRDLRHRLKQRRAQTAA